MESDRGTKVCLDEETSGGVQEQGTAKKMTASRTEVDRIRRKPQRILDRPNFFGKY
jgi:hypothetical protein